MVGSSHNEFLKGVAYIKKNESIFHVNTFHQADFNNWIKVEDVEIQIISDMICHVNYIDVGWRYNHRTGVSIDLDGGYPELSMKYGAYQLENEFIEIYKRKIRTGFFNLKVEEREVKKTTEGWVKLKDFTPIKKMIRANNWFIETQNGVSKKIGV